MAVAVVDVQVNSQSAVRNLQQINGASKAATAGIGALRGAITGLVGAVSAAAAIRFVVVKTAELETQTRSIQTLTGSVDKAKQIISELQAIGAVTPFTSTELIDTAKRLTAFGVSADKVVETTRRLGDVAGATGANLGELSLAYGQVIAKGRLQGEELLQFQERGIALQDELRKMYGLSGKEFQDALSKGRISAEAVEVAIARLTEKGGKYANGAIAQSDTLAGKFSTLTDGIETIARRIGQVLTPALKEVIDFANLAISKISEALAGPSYKQANDQLYNTRARIAELKDAIKAAEKAGISLQKSAPLLGVDGQVVGGGQPVLPGMRFELQQLEKDAKRLQDRLQELRGGGKAKGKPNVTPPPLLASSKEGKARSMEELIGGRIQQEFEQQKALMETQKQLQLNAVATASNAEQAARMVEYAFQYKETQAEINTLTETLKKREEAREAIVAQAKDKDTARLALLQREDQIRSQIQIRQEHLNTIAAKQQGQIIDAGKKEQEQQKKLQETGQQKLQSIQDEEELLRAKLRGNEAEVALRQQLRDLTKEMTPEQKKQAQIALGNIEALKQQIDAASQLKSVYMDIGMSIKSGVVDAIQGAIDGTKSLQQVATDLLRSISNKLLDVAVNLALFGSISGTGKQGQGLLGFLPRANGGSVSSGRGYLVGERGPELFMPGRSGAIAPTGSFGSNVNVVVNVDASGSSVSGGNAMANQLGRLVSAAVQAEIIKQKRPGGVLA